MAHAIQAEAVAPPPTSRLIAGRAILAGALLAKIIGPARQVGKTRYRIGLILFTLALLEAWLFPYIERHFPTLSDRDRVWNWFSDGMLITSIFVLGGDFWGKLRALYIHGATVQFPPEPAR